MNWVFNLAFVMSLDSAILQGFKSHLPARKIFYNYLQESYPGKEDYILALYVVDKSRQIQDSFLQDTFFTMAANFLTGKCYLNVPPYLSNLMFLKAFCLLKQGKGREARKIRATLSERSRCLFDFFYSEFLILNSKKDEAKKLLKSLILKCSDPLIQNFARRLYNST